MKRIANFRHAEGSDYGSFEREGKQQTYDNVLFLCIDDSDTEWYSGKPSIEKVPYEVIAKCVTGIKPDSLDSLVGCHVVIEKDSKLVTRNGAGALSEKVTGFYVFKD